MAGGARAGGDSTVAAVAAASASEEPLEAAGAWGDDEDVLNENKVLFL